MILEEAGAENIIVDINSIGDKDCRGGYVKELTSYYRKHAHDLPAVDRERLKTNPIRILDSKDPKTIAINENAPDAVSALCNGCKHHFKVLEYLDEMGVSYRINKTLFEDFHTTVAQCLRLLNKQVEDGAPMAIAGGGRYDYLGKMLGSKKDIPAIGMAIGVDRVVESSWYANSLHES